MLSVCAALQHVTALRACKQGQVLERRVCTTMACSVPQIALHSPSLAVTTYRDRKNKTEGSKGRRRRRRGWREGVRMKVVHRD